MRKNEAKNNRGEILFKKLVSNDKFQLDVELARDELSIDIEGFSEMSQIYNWYSKVYSQTSLVKIDPTKKRSKKKVHYEGEKDNLVCEADKILKKWRLPLNDWWRKRVIEYIIAKGKIDFLPPIHTSDPFIQKVNFELSKTENYVDIRLYEGVTQRDVKDFISKYWKSIKGAYRIGTKKQIRKEGDARINDKIIELNKISKKELAEGRVKRGMIGRTKAMLIAEIIREEFTDSEITSDAVGAIIYRRGKYKR